MHERHHQRAGGIGRRDERIGRRAQVALVLLYGRQDVRIGHETTEAVGAEQVEVAFLHRVETDVDLDIGPRAQSARNDVFVGEALGVLLFDLTR